MNFMEIAKTRQSCRRYDENRAVEPEKLEAILQAYRLSPSACNCQPYHITVCQGDLAREVALLTRGLGGMNKFAVQAPVMLVLSGMPYNKSAAFAAEKKKIDYRSIDIGIACAYLTAEATAQGLGTCILGWFNDEKVRKLLDIEHPVQLIITLGYPAEGDPLRKKTRKSMEELVTYKE